MEDCTSDFIDNITCYDVLKTMDPRYVNMFTVIDYFAKNPTIPIGETLIKINYMYKNFTDRGLDGTDIPVMSLLKYAKKYPDILESLCHRIYIIYNESSNIVPLLLDTDDEDIIDSIIAINVNRDHHYVIHLIDNGRYDIIAKHSLSYQIINKLTMSPEYIDYVYKLYDMGRSSGIKWGKAIVRDKELMKCFILASKPEHLIYIFMYCLWNQSYDEAKMTARAMKIFCSPPYCGYGKQFYILSQMVYRMQESNLSTIRIFLDHNITTETTFNKFYDFLFYVFEHFPWLSCHFLTYDVWFMWGSGNRNFLTMDEINMMHHRIDVLDNETKDYMSLLTNDGNITFNNLGNILRYKRQGLLQHRVDDERQSDVMIKCR